MPLFILDLTLSFAMRKWIIDEFYNVYILTCSAIVAYQAIQYFLKRVRCEQRNSMCYSSKIIFLSIGADCCGVYEILPNLHDWRI